MSTKRKAKPVKQKSGVSWGGVLIIIIILFLVMGNVDSVMTSTAPKVKRCDICHAEVKEWWTIEFTHTRAWDTILDGHDDSGYYVPSYTVCGECWYKITTHIKGMD